MPNLIGQVPDIYPIPTTGNPYAPSFLNPPKIEVVNRYNIMLDNPTNSLRLSGIDEDILPTSIYGNDYTINGRLSTISYVRGILLNNEDGRDIRLDGKSKMSLMKKVKLIDLNPYRDKQKINPYSGLPNDFLLYRTCYPMRYNSTHGVVCARESIGIQLRLYNLRERDYDIYKKSINGITQEDKFKNSKIWQDVIFYKTVLNNMIKKKVCPNFIGIYGFYISENCNIDFKKVDKLRGKYRERRSTYVSKDKYKDVYLDPPKPKLSPIDELLLPERERKKYEEQQKKEEYQRKNVRHVVRTESLFENDKPKTEVMLDPETDIGKGLIVLTEGANYNLLGWASPNYIYGDHFNVKRMVSSGFHEDDVWRSIIFQIMAGLHALNKQKIYIKGLNLSKDVLIKEISTRGATTTCWKYIIDGISYYIPNYGFIALFDSGFKGIEFDSDNKNIFSIECNKFDQLPSTVKNMINNINENEDLSKAFKTQMQCFMNNRIGTRLKESEIGFIIRQNPTYDDVKVGQIVIKVNGNEDFKFVLITEKLGNDKLKIVTKGNNIRESEEDISVNEIYTYPTTEKIEQVSKVGSIDLNEDDVIETYEIKD